MRAYGYKRKDCGNELLELRELTISANPAVLRRIAGFILRCAADIEQSPHAWSHEHFAFLSGKHTPDFIVYNPQFMQKKRPR
jgi:hypothetical protein